MPTPYTAPDPGARRITPAERESMRRLHDDLAARVLALSHGDMVALSHYIEGAQRRVAQAMKQWIDAHPVDGKLRWSAHHALQAGVMLDQVASNLAELLGTRMTTRATRLMGMGAATAEADLTRLRRSFGSSVALPDIRRAVALASARSYVIPRMRTSAARYGINVRQDIRRALVEDMLAGRPLRDTIQRLVDHGGPRGLVALRGVAGEQGAIVELIPEGLFARYRSWADRVVRTEYAAAANVATTEAHRDLQAQLPHSIVIRQWMAAPGCCLRTCREINGQEQPVGTPFRSSVLGTIEQPPAHPYCRCTVGISGVRHGTPAAAPPPPPPPPAAPAPAPKPPTPRRRRRAPAAPSPSPPSPPSPPPAPLPTDAIPASFAAPADAARWCAERWPSTSFAFNGMHPEAAHAIAGAWQRAANALPEVARKIEKVDTGRLGAHTYAQASYAPGSDSHRSITLARQAFGIDPALLRVRTSADARSLWHPPGTEDIGSILTHEFGHHVDWFLGTTIPRDPAMVSDFARRYRELQAAFVADEGRMAAPSHYGATKISEKRAEGFASIHHTPEPLQVEYTKRLRQYINDAFALLAEAKAKAAKPTIAR